jgi:beta-lactamase regulating signal transducer with metallopeptidase domain
MSPLVDLSLSVLIDLGAKSLVVMLACCAAAAAFHRASAAWRHLVWTLGIVALLVLPGLALVLPAWSVGWLPEWPGRTGAAAVVASLPEAAAADAQGIPSPITPRVDAAPLGARPGASAVQRPVAPAGTDRTARPWLWSAIVVSVWLAGLVLALVPVVVGLAQLRRLRRGATRLANADWLALLAEVRDQLGVRQSVRLLRSPAAAMPLTWGTVRPVLLLPAEADEWNPARRRMVLWHELAHIRRGDWLTQMLASAACAVYWFNPLVGLAARQMRTLRERACDDLVLACGAMASDYASELLALAAGLADPRLATLAAVPMARRSLLEYRLRAILDRGRSRAALTTAAVLVGGLIAAGTIAPLAMLRAGQPRDDQPAVRRDGEKPLDKIQPKKEPDKPKPALPTAETPAQKPVTIRGKAIDAETGKPIERLMVQSGKFDPADPTKVTWGFTLDRPGSRGGSFSASVRWAGGWTSRVLADGYIPQPVVTAQPPTGKDVIEVTLRLLRGRLVPGEVVDHTGKPVAGASVFAIGPTGVNLSGGQAWTSWGEKDSKASPVFTDSAGRFELPAGEAKTLAVSYQGFDAWPAEIPADGPVKVALPEPARVEIALDIDGAEKESQVFYQLLTHRMPGFAGLLIERQQPIANGGKLTLAALPPGKYQICRQLMHRLPEVGMGAMLDREFFEIKAGETKTVRWVRDKGARVRGKVTWPAGTAISGVIVSIRAEKAVKSPFDEHEWQTMHASLVAAEDGTFLSERVPPGTYLLVAEGYTPLTPEERASTRLGLRGPAFHAEMKVEVPAEGELKLPDLPLTEIRR